MARENRAFLRRAVRFLAGEAWIRQFLDIGTGLPTQGNVHEVAREVEADARVVYADASSTRRSGAPMPRMRLSIPRARGSTAPSAASRSRGGRESVVRG